MGPDGLDSSDLTKIAGKAVVGHVLHLRRRAGVRVPGGQGLRRGLQEEVRARTRSRSRPRRTTPPPSRSRPSRPPPRRGGKAAQPRAGLGAVRKSKHTGITGAVEFDEQGRPEEGALLRAAGGVRRPGEVGRQQGSEAADDRGAAAQEARSAPASARGEARAPPALSPLEVPGPMDFELLIGIFPQVLLDGLILGFMYALIALGYTMVYGVLEFINFAHSEIFIVGAFVGVEILLGLQGARAGSTSLPWSSCSSSSSWSGMVVSGGPRRHRRARRLPAAPQRAPPHPADLRHRRLVLPPGRHPALRVASGATPSTSSTRPWTR